MWLGKTNAEEFVTFKNRDWMGIQHYLMAVVVWIFYNTEYMGREKTIWFYNFRSYTDNSKKLYFNLLIKWYFGNSLVKKSEGTNSLHPIYSGTKSIIFLEAVPTIIKTQKVLIAMPNKVKFSNPGMFWQMFIFLCAIWKIY